MKRATRIFFGCVIALLMAQVTAAPAIRAFEADSMKQIVAAQKGKPFVLVVWSLDCQYCAASMAALSREKRRNKSLKVITLATDTLDDAQAAGQIGNKLKSTGLASDAWAFGSAAPEQLRYAIDPNWHGEMPRSYWFDARGERRAHSGVITSDVVARMLAEPLPRH